ncbi:hypothetical protein NDU88_001669 [Pleurodeles waltl]|uniref:Uncharacterized protein n=1 Tax=Pleurodeles waltl TaxID=8319 RepID=A0AAV7KS29_PLEWA|nr:hypothetical protein NDU88_001669 [Pleurodeles waltl]
MSAALRGTAPGLSLVELQLRSKHGSFEENNKRLRGPVCGQAEHDETHSSAALLHTGAMQSRIYGMPAG